LKVEHHTNQTTILIGGD